MFDWCAHVGYGFSSSSIMEMGVTVGVRSKDRDGGGLPIHTKTENSCSGSQRSKQESFQFITSYMRQDRPKEVSCRINILSGYDNMYQK